MRSNRDDDRHVAFLEGADIVIHDAQYTLEEYAGRVGWGHSTIEYAVDVGCAAGAGQTVLFHHDPSHDDDTVDRLLLEAQQRAGARTTVSAACEGSDLHVTGSGHGAASSAARRATTRPALDSLCTNTLILTSDTHLRSVATEAAFAERLVMFDPADVQAVDPDRVLIIADVDDGGTALDAALSQLSTGQHEAVDVVAVSRHIGVQVGAHAISEWLVWPASVAHVRTKLRAAILRRARAAGCPHHCRRTSRVASPRCARWGCSTPHPTSASIATPAEPANASVSLSHSSRSSTTIDNGSSPGSGSSTPSRLAMSRSAPTRSSGPT